MRISRSKGPQHDGRTTGRGQNGLFPAPSQYSDFSSVPFEVHAIVIGMQIPDADERFLGAGGNESSTMARGCRQNGRSREQMASLLQTRAIDDVHASITSSEETIDGRRIRKRENGARKVRDFFL
jgi:hypothetical protein